MRSYSIGPLDYMDIDEGDIVQLRDGRRVTVTNMSDQDPEAYRWYAADGVTINAEMPVETIFMGVICDYSIGEGLELISDMSEIRFLFK